MVALWLRRLSTFRKPGVFALILCCVALRRLLNRDRDGQRVRLGNT